MIHILKKCVCALFQLVPIYTGSLVQMNFVMMKKNLVKYHKK